MKGIYSLYPCHLEYEQKMIEKRKKTIILSCSKVFMLLSKLNNILLKDIKILHLFQICKRCFAYFITIVYWMMASKYACMGDLNGEQMIVL